MLLDLFSVLIFILLHTPIRASFFKFNHCACNVSQQSVASLSDVGDGYSSDSDAMQCSVSENDDVGCLYASHRGLYL
jgi:hypothetical protein